MAKVLILETGLLPTISTATLALCSHPTNTSQNNKYVIESIMHPRRDACGFSVTANDRLCASIRIS
jgi:hypothetical protein